jgi:hypothetical protein
MSTGPVAPDDGNAPTSAYAEPLPPPDDRSARAGFRGRAAILGSRAAPPAPATDRYSEDDDLDDDELTDALLRDRPVRRGSSADTGPWPRVILTLGLTFSVVILVFIGVLLRLPPSDFAQYISPLTGIAGLVLGYWFGSDKAR